jgi:hypothetical protein
MQPLTQYKAKEVTQTYAPRHMEKIRNTQQGVTPDICTHTIYVCTCGTHTHVDRSYILGLVVQMVGLPAAVVYMRTCVHLHVPYTSIV